MLNILTTSYVG